MAKKKKDCCWLFYAIDDASFNIWANGCEQLGFFLLFVCEYAQMYRAILSDVRLWDVHNNNRMDM